MRKKYETDLTDEPKRWIVERTFARLNHSDQLSKDYELTSAEALIKISHIHTLLKRLWTPVLKNFSADMNISRGDDKIFEY